MRFTLRWFCKTAKSETKVKNTEWASIYRETKRKLANHSLAGRSSFNKLPLSSHSCQKYVEGSTSPSPAMLGMLRTPRPPMLGMLRTTPELATRFQSCVNNNPSPAVYDCSTAKVNEKINYPARNILSEAISRDWQC